MHYDPNHAKGNILFDIIMSLYLSVFFIYDVMYINVELN